MYVSEHIYTERVVVCGDDGGPTIGYRLFFMAPHVFASWGVGGERSLQEFLIENRTGCAVRSGSVFRCN